MQWGQDCGGQHGQVMVAQEHWGTLGNNLRMLANPPCKGHLRAEGIQGAGHLAEGTGLEMGGDEWQMHSR